MPVAFGFDRHEICRPGECEPGDRPGTATELSEARRLLRGHLGDAIAMARMRRLLREDSFQDLREASDHEVLEALARSVVSGRLSFRTGVRRPLPRIPVSVAAAPPPASPEPEPLRSRAPAPPAPAPAAPAPIPATPGMSAQAAALTEAARDGTPFCEECAKARAEHAQQAAF